MTFLLVSLFISPGFIDIVSRWERRDKKILVQWLASWGRCKSNSWFADRLCLILVGKRTGARQLDNRSNVNGSRCYCTVHTFVTKFGIELKKKCIFPVVTKFGIK